jgi:UDPglucose 6-dehydrogenase
LIELAREHGLDFKIVQAVIEVNGQRIPKMLDKVRTAVDGGLSGRTVGLLGLTFKPNTDDLRASPAVAVLEGLLEEGACVRVYDPVAMPIAARTQRSRVVYCRDEYDAAEGAEALVVATEWNQFRGIDIDKLKTRLKAPVIVDLRNVYEPSVMKARGFRYYGVGR